MIASYKQPGGNVPGLSSQGEDTLPKMLQYITFLPSGTRIAVPYNTTNPARPRLWQGLEQAGKNLGTNLERIGIAGRKDFGGAFDIITSSMGTGSTESASVLNRQFVAKFHVVPDAQSGRAPEPSDFQRHWSTPEFIPSKREGRAAIG